MRGLMLSHYSYPAQPLRRVVARQANIRNKAKDGRHAFRSQAISKKHSRPKPHSLSGGVTGRHSRLTIRKESLARRATKPIGSLPSRRLSQAALRMAVPAADCRRRSVTDVFQWSSVRSQCSSTLLPLKLRRRPEPQPHVAMRMLPARSITKRAMQPLARTSAIAWIRK